MDHLPCPASAIGREKILVPYVCREKYDGGPFMTYPSRRDGIPDLYLVGLFPGQFPYHHQMQLASLPQQELESFYQAWLFFGLIREILGSLYVPEDYIYTCGHTRAISSSELTNALEEWVTRVQAGTANPSVTYAHVAHCLCLTHAALSIQAIGSKLNSNIRLSLVSLGQNLAYAANKAFGIEKVLRDNRCPSTWCQLIDDRYWEERFQAHGWCVTEVKLILDTTLSLQTRHFLACLDKRDAERNHQGCDPRQCLAYQIDLGTYQTKHVSKECNCRELSVDPEVLHGILKRKALPLIRVRQGHTLEELSIDIVASRPTSRYVALSHVWADGLGNPKSNALPRCQLSNLGKVIQDLDEVTSTSDAQDYYVHETSMKNETPRVEKELFLWCDTLCCPVETEEAKHLALEYMYQTYENAAHVLVLDASLRRYDVERLDIDEVSIRIFTSPWMRRLWTLQEGALPALTNRLWFRLAHRAVNLRELRINARDKYFSSVGRRGLAGDILRQLGSFANIFLKDNSTHPRADLPKVMEALHHRSVSVLADEPLLIGNLLGLNPAQILNGDDGAIAQRMHRLWRLLPSTVHGIPSALVFRVGPRLVEPGLRWAPSTLLIDNDINIAILPSEKEEDRAFLTPSDGLLVCMHGFRLSLASGLKGLPSPRKSIEQLGNRNSLMMNDDAGSWYHLSRRLPVEQDNFLTDKPLSEVILESEYLWVIHPDPEFPRPSQYTGQSSVGLIVEVGSNGTMETEGVAVKKARTKLHISIAPIQASALAEFALGTALSAKLISESPALRKLAIIEHGQSEQSLTPSPSSSKTIALEELASEVHQLAMNEAIAVDGKKFHIPLVEDIIKRVIWGQYICMREKVPKSQPWCVD